MCIIIKTRKTTLKDNAPTNKQKRGDVERWTGFRAEGISQRLMCFDSGFKRIIHQIHVRDVQWDEIEMSNKTVQISGLNWRDPKQNIHTIYSKKSILFLTTLPTAFSQRQESKRGLFFSMWGPWAYMEINDRPIKAGLILIAKHNLEIPG